MRTATLRSMLALVMVLALASTGFAGASKTIEVSAHVPTIGGGFNVNVTRINASTDEWGVPNPNQPIDFQTLVYDAVNGVFGANYYYAVDIGVLDNSGAPWMITHARNSVALDAFNNLDNNINVSFTKESQTAPAINLQKVSYANSQNISFMKSQLTGGWLRVYYGIATGLNDAPGALPIDATKPTGIYQGSVTITLAP
ncbi:MAG: hypothetical protein ISS27_01540 [Candidatus Omnitrophica bacterium]|nr:hypothetical protein [Candidatus Omnitrophota bacterium]